MLRKIKKNEKGFTLVELMVVIAILAILATLIVPRIMANIQDAQNGTDIGNARTIASEIAVHNAEADDANDVVNDDTKGYVTETTYTNAGLTLPNGVSWPNPDVVTIVISANGDPEVVVQP